MDHKTFVERPVARSRASGRRWLPAFLASVCMVIGLLGLAKLTVTKDVIRNEPLLNIVDPLRMTPDVSDASTTISGTTEDSEAQNLGKRQTGSYLSTGINWNGIQQRKDWNTFAADADLLNLFLCGMEAVQAMSQSDLRSFFQLAAIHGAPAYNWNGVAGINAGYGFCPHASILFPSWHRPYLATLEQVIGDAMRNLSNQYPSGTVRTRYQQAAARFRLPYWDWASNAPLPALLGSQATVTVQKPQGTVTITNPMIAYVFHPFSSNFFGWSPFNKWRKTTRQPDSSGNARPTVVNQQLSANQASLRNRVYNLLTYQSDFKVFSNKAWNGGNSGNQDSIESVHDLIHGVVGGNGHMGYVDTSAMDPIFWLHHCNVDRIIAIWQALYPTSWTVSQTAIFDTRTINAGQTESATTPLSPFFQSSGIMWNSNTARDTKSFYYVYPETDGLTQTQTRARVNSLYGSTAPQTQVQSVSKRDFSGRRRRLRKGDKYSEWSADVRLNKRDTPGSYLINIFIGEPSNGVDWTNDPNFVGSYYLLTRNGACDGCSDDPQVTGSVPLTSKLIDRVNEGELEDLSPRKVRPYLRKNLRWTVQRPDGSYLSPREIRSLKVSVSSATVTIPESPDQKAPITEWTTDRGITNGKPGGLNNNDQA